MVNSFATNISHIGTKATGAVKSAGNQISKGAEIAVNFVLASAGIMLAFPKISLLQCTALWKSSTSDPMKIVYF